MNNDAFKKMVRDRAQIKSSKEIAREAVEDEFQRKKKRKYGGDSSDSGGEQEAEGDDSGKKRFGRSKQSQNEEDDIHLDISSKYRDRAKERREGKPQADEFLLKGVASAAADPAADKSSEELSKYLGGDEEHTHLVQGLDVVLARKVKREWHKEKKQQPTTTAKESKQQMVETTFVETVDQAKDLLQQCIRDNNNQTESKVGSELSQYLQKVHKYTLETPLLLPKNVTCSSAGRTIQRSTLAFALDGHPSQISRAWEMPREMMHGAFQQEALARATSLDISLIDRIQWALSKRIKETEEVQQPAKPTPMSSTTEKVVQQKNTRATSQDDDDNDDDEDDDIFGDVGDYVPSQTQSQTESARPKAAVVSAGSIFSGLVTEDQQSNEEDKGSTAVDTFVASLYSRLQKGREGAESTLKGMLGSAADYNEMDVDFDGRLEDEQEEDDGGKSSKKKKKKRGEETTVAASEYGAARSRSTRETDK
jgi:hypothetical protein